MNDVAIDCIFEQLKTNLVEPDKHCKIEEFEELTYKRWAVLELLQMILDNPTKPAEDTIEEFVIFVKWYALIAKHPKIRYIFRLASESSQNLLDYYLESI